MSLIDSWYHASIMVTLITRSWNPISETIRWFTSCSGSFVNYQHGLAIEQFRMMNQPSWKRAEYREHGRYRYSNASIDRDKRLYDPQAVKVASEQLGTCLCESWTSDFKMVTFTRLNRVRIETPRHVTSRWSRIRTNFRRELVLSSKGRRYHVSYSK